MLIINNVNNAISKKIVSKLSFEQITGFSLP